MAKVFINPGHGTSDPGACGFGITEAETCWEIGKLTEARLAAAGVAVEVLQSDDLPAVPAAANDWGADVFVSIHCNACNGSARGTETLVYREGTQGAALAQAVQERLVRVLGTVDRGLKERPGLCVLRSTDMPAILVETAFIDEAGDNALLVNKKPEIAGAIADGVLAYLGIAGGASSSSAVAPNGQPYDQNDVDYLLGQGYTMADALSFLDTTDKYSNSDIRRAIDYAESRVGTTGYGNNGCTEWVRQFLLKANHWFGQLMTDGSQGNLMWVPNIYDYAKANGLFKSPEEGGAAGDICLLETNHCMSDGPDHVVIATGDGGYWGNSSSRNLIVKSDIAYDYGADAVHGYVATGVGSAGRVVQGQSSRSMAEIVADAGSSSCVNLAPNGMAYEDNDIEYLVNQGYSTEEAIEELARSPKYTRVTKVAPNGKPYEQNDVDYLLGQGYTLDAAYAYLSTADKYVK